MAGAQERRSMEREVAHLLQECSEQLRSEKLTARRAGVKFLEGLFEVEEFEEKVHQLNTPVGGKVSEFTSWARILYMFLTCLKLDHLSVSQKGRSQAKSDRIILFRKYLEKAESRGPRLHLSPFGQKFLKKLIDHIVDVFRRKDTLLHLLPDYSAILETIVQCPCYQNLLNGDMFRSLFDTYAAILLDEGVVRTAYVQTFTIIMEANPNDSYEDLPAIVSFYKDWFSNWSKYAKDPGVGKMMLRSCNGLMRRYGRSLSPLLLEAARPIISYIQRSWHQVPRSKLEDHSLFIVYLLQLLEPSELSHYDHGVLLREVRSIFESLGHPSVLQNMGSSQFRRFTLKSEASWIIDESSTGYFTMLADLVIYLEKCHRGADRSAASTAPSLLGRYNSSEERKEGSSGADGKESGRKRQRTQSPWERLIERILDRTSLEAKLISPDTDEAARFSFSVSQTGTQARVRSKMMHRAWAADFLPWVQLFSILLERDGAWELFEGRIDQVADALQELLQELVQTEVLDVQCWIIHCLTQLSLVCSHLIERKSDREGEANVRRLDDLWLTVWRTLLRTDLPFSASTASVLPGSRGELVLCLLSSILNFNLSLSLSLEELETFCSLPAFRIPRPEATGVILSTLLAALGRVDSTALSSLTVDPAALTGEQRQTETGGAVGESSVTTRTLVFILEFLHAKVLHVEYLLSKEWKSLLLDSSRLSLLLLGAIGGTDTTHVWSRYSSGALMTLRYKLCQEPSVTGPLTRNKLQEVLEVDPPRFAIKETASRSGGLNLNETFSSRRNREVADLLQRGSTSQAELSEATNALDAYEGPEPLFEALTPKSRLQPDRSRRKTPAQEIPDVRALKVIAERIREACALLLQSPDKRLQSLDLSLFLLVLVRSVAFRKKQKSLLREISFSLNELLLGILTSLREEKIGLDMPSLAMELERLEFLILQGQKGEQDHKKQRGETFYFFELSAEVTATIGELIEELVDSGEGRMEDVGETQTMDIQDSRQRGKIEKLSSQALSACRKYNLYWCFRLLVRVTPSIESAQLIVRAISSWDMYGEELPASIVLLTLIPQPAVVDFAVSLLGNLVDSRFPSDLFRQMQVMRCICALADWLFLLTKEDREDQARGQDVRGDGAVATLRSSDSLSAIESVIFRQLTSDCPRAEVRLARMYAAKKLWVVFSERFASFLDELWQGMKDPSDWVRQYTSHCLQEPFRLFPESHAGVFATVTQSLPLPLASLSSANLEEDYAYFFPSLLLTSALSLSDTLLALWQGPLSRFSGEFHSCLVSLLTMAARTELSPSAAILLEALAKRLTYRSLKNFLWDFSPPIFFLWINAHVERVLEEHAKKEKEGDEALIRALFESFPYSLFGCNNLFSFFSSFKEVLIGVISNLEGREREKLLSSLVLALGTGIRQSVTPELLSPAIEKVVAYGLVRGGGTASESGEVRRERAEESPLQGVATFLKGVIGSSTASSLVSDALHRIFQELLHTWVTCGGLEDTRPVKFQWARWQSELSASSLIADHPASVSLVDQLNPMDVMSSIYACALQASDRASQSRVIEVLEETLAWFGSRLFVSPCEEVCLRTTLWIFQAFQGQRQSRAALLLQAYSGALKNLDKGKALSASALSSLYLHTVVSSLVWICQSSGSRAYGTKEAPPQRETWGSDDTVKLSLSKLLQMLSTYFPALMSGYRPELEEIVSYFSTVDFELPPARVVGGEESLSSLVERLDELTSKSLSTSMMAEVLDYTLVMLVKTFKEVPSLTSPTARRQTRKAVLRLCGPGQNESIKLRAASCLGTLGMVQINVDREEDEVEEQERLYSRPSVYLPDPRENFLRSLLDVLLFLLQDRKPQVVTTSQKALGRLLEDPALRSALTESGEGEKKRRERRWKSYLDNFLRFHTNRTSADLFPPMRSLKVESLFKSWDARDGSYEEWVTGVARCLSSLCKDNAFAYCEAILGLKPEVAEFLFPFMLWDIVGREDVSEIPKLVRALILKDLRAFTDLPASQYDSSSTQYKALQTIISALNFLRKAQVQTFRSRFSHGSSQSFSSFPASGAPGDETRPSLPYTLFFSDDHFLLFAEAALRCRQSYLALIFIELYAETKQGRLKMPEERDTSSFFQSFPSMTAAGQQQSKMVLLRAFQAIGEQDCLQAISAADLETRIAVSQHQSHWGKLMGLLETANDMERVSSTPSLSLPSSSPSSASDTSKRITENDSQMIFSSSLIRLGLPSLVGPYIADISRKEVSVKQSLLERAYEAAWRLQDWNFTETKAEHLHLPLPERERFQESIFFLMKMLKGGNEPSFRGRMERLKLSLLRSLDQPGSTTSQDMQGLSDCLNKLHILGEIAEAWDVCRGGKEEVGEGSVRSLYRRWKRKELLLSSNFTRSETLLSLRGTLLSLVSDVLASHGVESERLAESTVALVDQYLTGSLLARDATQIQLCLPLLAKAWRVLEGCDTSASSLSRGIPGNSLLASVLRYRWGLEYIRVLWAQQEPDVAINLSREITSDLETFLRRVAPTILPSPVSGKATSAATNHGVLGGGGMAFLHESNRVGGLVSIFATLLSLSGSWVASSKSENSQDIIDAYYRKAIQALHSGSQARRSSVTREEEEEESGKGIDLGRAHQLLGNYVSNLYFGVKQRVQSPEWAAWSNLLSFREEELKTIEKKRKTKNQYHRALQIECARDREERERVEASLADLLLESLSEYSKCLAFSSQEGDFSVVFRFCSLWFSNAEDRRVNEVMKGAIASIPSYKFVPLVYQIFSRIEERTTSSRSDFQDVLSSLIIKICSEHPHHSLLQLLALSRGDEAQSSLGSHISSSPLSPSPTSSKAKEARRHLERLKRSPSLLPLVESLEVLSSAYHILAFFDTSPYHKQRKSTIPFEVVKVHGRGSFQHCLRERMKLGDTAVPAVVTLPLPLRKDADYKNIVRIASFPSNFSIAETGIHRPKIIFCIGSDGRPYKQLVKGKDDIRQDAVMEQVFDTVNEFLTARENTEKRKLKIWTYKVVPLSPQSGVLEWVENTQPLRDLLVNSRQGLHVRYRPHDWTNLDCSSFFKTSTPEERLQRFTKLLANFSPVLHHFFLENFPDPVTWFSKRLQYTRSVAVNSVIGYVLGIGDRHTSNILIHKTQAKMIQIDFGVILEQGKCLPTPETVPFRLTQNIIDGMGITGVDGVFRRACEETLKVLRDNSISLMTVLEVFLHDPLFSWTLSPIKALQVQRDELAHEEGKDTSTTSLSRKKAVHSRGNGVDGVATDTAQRVLLRIKQKLEGYEDPNGAQMSVEGQVKHLINEATDNRNLCRLFVGWAPWI